MSGNSRQVSDTEASRLLLGISCQKKMWFQGLEGLECGFPLLSRDTGPATTPRSYRDTLREGRRNIGLYPFRWDYAVKKLYKQNKMLHTGY